MVLSLVSFLTVLLSLRLVGGYLVGAPKKSADPSFSIYVITAGSGRHPDRTLDDKLGYASIRPHNASVDHMASHELYSTRVKMAMRTWVPRTSKAKIVFVDGNGAGETGSMLADLGETSQRVSFAPTSCSAQDKVSFENGWSLGVCCKTMSAMEMSLEQKPRRDWLVRVVDDTYVFEDNVVELLRGYNHRKGEDILLGSEAVKRVFYDDNTTEDIAHASGGAGIVFSRPLVEKFVQHKAEFLSMCRQDDVDLAAFARDKFGVSVIGSNAFSQLPRFENVEGLNAATRRPVDCGASVSPPKDVFAQFGGGKPWLWFETGPFAAQPFTKLALVHSDPVRAWPKFAELSDMSRQSASCDRELLSYLDNPGGSSLAQMHFFGLSALSICLTDKRPWWSRLATSIGAKAEACTSESTWKTKAFAEFS